MGRARTSAATPADTLSRSQVECDGRGHVPTVSRVTATRGETLPDMGYPRYATHSISTWRKSKSIDAVVRVGRGCLNVSRYSSLYRGSIFSSRM